MANDFVGGQALELEKTGNWNIYSGGSFHRIAVNEYLSTDKYKPACTLT